MIQLSTSFDSEATLTANAASDIVKAMEAISNGADQQTSQIERCVSGISELEQQVVGIGRITEVMKRMSVDTAVYTKQGSESVEQLNRASKHTEDRLTHMISSLDTLVSRFKEISTVSTAIEEISLQTNLLAVNASIEAAHAGVHGKGFAVIANQVRELSDQSKESSRHIQTVIHSLHSQMKNVQTDLEETSLSLDEQNSAIAHTVAAFTDIELSTARLSASMDEIHHHIEKAMSKNKALVTSIQIVSSVAEDAVSSVQEVNATANQQNPAIRLISEQAGSVNQLAEQLFVQISRFKVT